MDQAYLNRTAEDLSKRVSSLILNSQTVAIGSVQLSGSDLVITTEPVSGVTKITSLKLLDEKGGLITERLTDLDVLDNQILEFRFNFTVKGAGG